MDWFMISDCCIMQTSKTAFQLGEDSDEVDKEFYGSNSVRKNIDFDVISTKSDKNRVTPSRLCKEKPIKYHHPSPTDDSRFQRKKFRTGSSKRRRLKGSKTRKNPSRASFRIFQKLKKSSSAASQSKRKPILRVARTVELVNQRDDKWRTEKSKLLFMLGLGLTPILNKPGVTNPFIVINSVDPDIMSQAKKRYNKAQAERIAKIKDARHRERLRRFEYIRNLRKLKLAESTEAAPVPTDVEVIDLSDDESGSQSSQTTQIGANFIHPDYPHLTISKIGPRSSQPQVPKIEPARKQSSASLAAKCFIAKFEKSKTLGHPRSRSRQIHTSGLNKPRLQNGVLSNPPNLANFRKSQILSNGTPVIVVTPSSAMKNYTDKKMEDITRYRRISPSLVKTKNRRRSSSDEDVILVE